VCRFFAFGALLFLLSCRQHTLDLRSDDALAVKEGGNASSSAPPAHPPTMAGPDAGPPSPVASTTSAPPPNPQLDAGMQFPPLETAFPSPNVDAGTVRCDPNAFPQGCQPGWVCDRDSRTCGPCTHNGECSGLVCDKDLHVCRGCESSRECSFDLVCLGGFCWPPCNLNSDCPVGQRCDLPPGADMKQCIYCQEDDYHPGCVPCDVDCPEPFVCSSRGRCELFDSAPPPPPPGPYMAPAPSSDVNPMPTSEDGAGGAEDADSESGGASGMLAEISLPSRDAGSKP
jgi:hypothetical protein